MLVHDRVNIGVAVAADSGLIVPVIQDADAKTVTAAWRGGQEAGRLAGERKLTPAQTSGGTFTISNLGMYGVEDFTAIINPPEAAILAVGATTREPAVVGDEIVPRYRLRYTLSSRPPRHRRGAGGAVPQDADQPDREPLADRRLSHASAPPWRGRGAGMTYCPS